MPRWYFSYQFVDVFARSAVDELVRVLPAEEPRPGKAKAQSRHKQRTEQAVMHLRRRLADFRAGNHLNLFQTARLSQRLQNELIERGYAVELAREIALDAIPGGN